MACYVYLLRSKATGHYYVGCSEHVERRLAEHNRGKVASTRGRRPWELVYTEAHATRSDAVRRERRLKQMKSSAWLQALIAGRAG